MPLVSICTKCKQPINEEKEDYYVTNKAAAQNKDQWTFAHIECPTGTRRKGARQGSEGWRVEDIEPPTGEGG